MDEKEWFNEQLVEQERATQKESSEKNQKNKRSKFAVVMVWLFCLLVIGLVLVVVWFCRAFVDIPNRSTLTQQQVLAITDFNDKDTPFLRSLKSAALEDYLTTGNLSKTEALEKNKVLIESILNGTLPEDKLQSSLNTLKKDYGATVKDIDTLQAQYYVLTLGKQTARLKEIFNHTKVEDLSTLTSETNSIISKSEIASNFYLKSSEDNNNLLSTINNSIDMLNIIEQQYQQISDLLRAIENKDIQSVEAMQLTLSEPLASQFNQNLEKLQTYLNQKDSVKATISKISELQNLIKNSVDIPNLKGKTLKEAKKIISDYNNSKDCSLKLEVKSGDRTSDKEEISSQTPDISDWDLIAKDGTIVVRTTEDKPKTPTSSSSTTKSSSSTPKNTTQSTTQSSNPSNSDNNGWQSVPPSSSTVDDTDSSNGWTTTTSQ